eukprot:3555661-Rhodomonas_salina.1
MSPGKASAVHGFAAAVQPHAGPPQPQRPQLPGTEISRRLPRVVLEYLGILPRGQYCSISVRRERRPYYTTYDKYEKAVTPSTMLSQPKPRYACAGGPYAYGAQERGTEDGHVLVPGNGAGDSGEEVSQRQKVRRGTVPAPISVHGRSWYRVGGPSVAKRVRRGTEKSQHLADRTWDPVQNMWR